MIGYFIVLLIMGVMSLPLAVWNVLIIIGHILEDNDE